MKKVGLRENLGDQVFLFDAPDFTGTNTENFKKQRKELLKKLAPQPKKFRKRKIHSFSSS